MELLPTDAMTLVRLESVDAVNASVQRLAGAFDAEGEISSTDEVLSGLFQFHLDPALLDSTRPLYLAADLDLAGPSMTLLAPARDAAGLAASAKRAGATSIVRDDWVGISSLPDYAAGKSSAPLPALPPGPLAAHLDMRSLLDTFGPFVEMGFDQAQSALADASVSEAAMGFDLEAMADLYIDAARTFMDSAESVGIALHDNGDEIAVHGRFTALEGSALDGLLTTAPLPATVPGSFDPDADIRFLAAGDWLEMAEAMEPMLDQLVQMYPAEWQPALKTYMQAWNHLYGKMGDCVLGYASFGADGMNVAAYFESPDPSGFAAALTDALASTGAAFEDKGVSFGEPRTVEIKGVTALQLPITIDLDEVAELTSASLPAEHRAQSQEQTRETLRRIYGTNPAVTIAHAADRVCVHLGDVDGEAELQAAAQRLLQKPGAVAPLLADLPGLPQPVQPFTWYHADFGALMGALSPISPAGADALPDLPLEITTWLALDGRHWHAGVSVDPEEIAAYGRAAAGR